MNQSNKSTGEGKPQPVEQTKPSPAKQDNFSVGRIFNGDSADSIRKKGK
ncbi:hypothetical protein [Serratia symbiotica]|nr:hypothetical protein [Serratia symbiotica]MBQ0955969.1 hypothetical protein [Serratia symbiotica]